MIKQEKQCEMSRREFLKKFTLGTAAAGFIWGHPGWAAAGITRPAQLSVKSGPVPKFINLFCKNQFIPNDVFILLGTGPGVQRFPSEFKRSFSLIYTLSDIGIAHYHQQFLTSFGGATIFVIHFHYTPNPDKPEPKRTWLVREITMPLFKNRTGVKSQITNKPQSQNYKLQIKTT